MLKNIFVFLDKYLYYKILTEFIYLLWRLDDKEELLKSGNRELGVGEEGSRHVKSWDHGSTAHIGSPHSRPPSSKDIKIASLAEKIRQFC